jgi:DNA repair protein RecO
MISLLASGVREQKSKLRHLLTLGTTGTFEFVEGKEVKRLTTVLPKKKFEKIFLSIEKRRVFSHVVNFIERVVVGEQENHDLYNYLLEGLEILENVEMQEVDCQTLEMAMVINILEVLGYWNGEEYTGYSAEVLVSIKNNKENLLKNINRAIESTHL